MSAPAIQFTPQRLHRMYVDRVTLGFWQYGQSGSVPSSLIRSCDVIVSQSTIPPVGRFTFATPDRHTRTSVAPVQITT